MKRTRSKGTALVALVALAAGGCTSSGTVLRAMPRMGESNVLATSADVRLVMTTPMKLDPRDNRIVPTQVTCAEPSPDIAKVVADSIGASSALAAAASGPNLPFSGKAEISGATQRSYAEAVAQMTERMATIQLLRDGLFRACEAYANGAITDVTYGVIISRFGDTMITMLLAELAAGNFGRKLATLTGTAEGTASSQAKELAANVENKVAAAADAKADLKESERQLAVANAAAESPSTGDGAQDENDAKQENKAKAEDANTKAEAADKKAEQEVKDAVSALVTAKVGTQAMASEANPDSKQAEDLGKTLLTMQDAYLKGGSLNAAMVSCIAALGANRQIKLEVTTGCIELFRIIAEKVATASAKQAGSTP